MPVLRNFMLLLFLIENKHFASYFVVKVQCLVEFWRVPIPLFLLSCIQRNRFVGLLITVYSTSQRKPDDPLTNVLYFNYISIVS